MSESIREKVCEVPVIVVSHSQSCVRLWPHARFPCSSLPPGVCSNSCPSSQWCHPIISSSLAPFSSCRQSFPASEAFPNALVLCIRWAKYWSFSFSINTFHIYLGLISFRIDWLSLWQAVGYEWQKAGAQQEHYTQNPEVRESLDL